MKNHRVTDQAEAHPKSLAGVVLGEPLLPGAVSKVGHSQDCLGEQQDDHEGGVDPEQEAAVVGHTRQTCAGCEKSEQPSSSKGIYKPAQACEWVADTGSGMITEVSCLRATNICCPKEIQ